VEIQVALRIPGGGGLPQDPPGPSVDAGLNCTSRIFPGFLEAGEQTGTLDRMAEWLADFYENEMEAALARFVSLAEPMIMAFMGAAAALLMVATIKPTILILQAL
jgi:type IV pilus assembly protein PilC